jgi:hypothetical protein
MVPGSPRATFEEVLLLRRAAPRRPYPSCPVPAAGPFREAFSFFSGWEASGTALFRRPNMGNLDLKAETFGLGVREVPISGLRRDRPGPDAEV